jgi:hypothetical protein
MDFAMAEDQPAKNSDDWLKVLSVCALLSSDIPEEYSGSAVIAALVVVGLSIYSRGVFLFLHLLATGFLIWTAFVSKESLIVGYAVLYSVLSVVLIAEGERRRIRKGHFLEATWWAGQALMHGLDVRHAYAAGGTSDFFTDLFLVISGWMVFWTIVQGVRRMLKREESQVERSTDDAQRPGRAA